MHDVDFLSLALILNLLHFYYDKVPKKFISAQPAIQFGPRQRHKFSRSMEWPNGRKLGCIMCQDDRRDGTSVYV